LDAKRFDYMREDDVVVFNAQELLYVAKTQAVALSESNYYPPLPARICAGGKSALANFTNVLVNMREGEFISDHNFFVGSKVAEVLCGGLIETNTMVSEQWMLDLERRCFMELVKTQETQSSIKKILSR
jgi:3-hydroxyacyl-CoA dehydrogenase